MRITNLDSLNAEDQKIIIDGEDWFIPGEIPVDYVLRLIDLQQKIKDNPENTEYWESQIYVIYEVFRKRHKDITLEQIKSMFTAKQVGRMIGVLLNSLGEADQLSESEKKTIMNQDSRATEENQSKKEKT